MDLSLSIVLILIIFGSLAVLFSKKVLENQTWRATMTPLASIIGSGFLISAPVLDKLAGDNAIWCMLGLCALSYSLGEVIRWNIAQVEDGPNKGALATVEKVARPFPRLCVHSLHHLLPLSILIFRSQDHELS